MEGDPGRDGRKNREVNLDRKSRRQLHLHEVAQLLEVLELRSDHLERKIMDFQFEAQNDSEGSKPETI